MTGTAVHSREPELIIGTGIDIVEVQRLRRSIEKWGDSFANRIFTADELAYCAAKVSKFQNLAGRFAAKEAIFKAVGNQRIGFKDICICNDKNGRPFCRVLNDKARGITIHISISHVKNYAVASAIATKKA